MTNLNPPPVRKEQKIAHLTLLWPVTAKIGTIAIYKLDASGLKLIRVLPGCRIEG